jgi:hypothetical protein
MSSKSPEQHIMTAYLAGLFDGEGTVGVYESWSVQEDGSRRPIWIYQQIANTYDPILERIVFEVGDKVVRKPRRKEHWPQGFVHNYHK